jgi:hypothetical protein
MLRMAVAQHTMNAQQPLHANVVNLGRIMQPITLVQSASEAIENISLFNVLLDDKENNYRLVKLLPHVQAWYAVEKEGQYFLGASKFIGYSGMSAELYGEESGATGRLDGRVTEKRLSSWATLITEDDSRYEKLHTALARFCADHGTFPNKRARISVFELTEKNTVTEMEQVKALSVLIRALSSEAKRELKRISFA